MKNRIILLGLTLTLASCGSWNRIGDLTTIGNRNVDDSKKYTLLTREVEAKAEADSDALEQAVDNLTQKYQGEFLRNVKVYVKSNGKKVKIIGHEEQSKILREELTYNWYLGMQSVEDEHDAIFIATKEIPLKELNIYLN